MRPPFSAQEAFLPKQSPSSLLLSTHPVPVHACTPVRSSDINCPLKESFVAPQEVSLLSQSMSLFSYGTPSYS